MALAQHIVIRPTDNRPLFNDIAARRRFTETIVTVGKSFQIAAWGAGDNHGHTLDMEDRPTAGELARRIELSLTRALGLEVGFQTASITPIRDQSHLYSTLPYVIRQHERHGLTCDPFHEGSSLPDAMGMRLLAPDLPKLLARVAPRLDLTGMLGPLGPVPAPDDAEAYAIAAAAVIGRADLRGRSPDVRLARRAVVELAHEAPSKGLRKAMSCSPRAIGRLRDMPPAPQPLKDAIVAQARWRNRARPRATAAAE